jgi:hypothetical protein
VCTPHRPHHKNQTPEPGGGGVTPPWACLISRQQRTRVCNVLPVPDVPVPEAPLSYAARRSSANFRVSDRAAAAWVKFPPLIPCILCQCESNPYSLASVRRPTLLPVRMCVWLADKCLAKPDSRVAGRVSRPAAADQHTPARAVTGPQLAARWSARFRA